MKNSFRNMERIFTFSQFSKALNQHKFSHIANLASINQIPTNRLATFQKTNQGFLSSPEKFGHNSFGQMQSFVSPLMKQYTHRNIASLFPYSLQRLDFFQNWRLSSGILNKLYSPLSGLSSSILDIHQELEKSGILEAEIVTIPPESKLNQHEESAEIVNPVEEKDIILLPTQIAFVSANVLKRVAQNPNELFSMSPRNFEELVAEFFHRSGCSVSLTPTSKDGGKDLIVTSKDQLGIESQYYVECKRYSRHNKVGIDIVRSMYGVVQADNTNKGIVVTTSSFTRVANAFAMRFKYLLELKDYNWLVNRLKMYTEPSTSNNNKNI